MIRVVLLLIGFLTLALAPPAGAQTPALAPALTADQARAALDVLNDPAKRAAVAATLNALVAAPPAGHAPAAVPPPAPAAPAPAAPAATTPAPAAPAAAPAPAPAPSTTVEGLTIPLAPDSLGAQVLVSASQFVNR